MINSRLIRYSSRARYHGVLRARTVDYVDWSVPDVAGTGFFIRRQVGRGPRCEEGFQRRAQQIGARICRYYECRPAGIEPSPIKILDSHAVCAPNYLSCPAQGIGFAEKELTECIQ